ncbi:hypothetical protein Bbelb_331030 [Branchiostoma belcheri]|nr:hypothetical protein Bbelb_331030 [Branchiostoma belcheri]
MAMQRGDEMVTRVCGYSLECTIHGGATSDKITVTRWSPGGDSVQGVRIFTTFYSNRWYNEASFERWVPRFEVAKHSIYGRPPGVYMYDAGIEGIPIRLNLVFCHPNADTRRWVADRQHTHVERGKNGVAPVVFTEALELSGVSCSTGEGERRRGIWAMMFLLSITGTVSAHKFEGGQSCGNTQEDQYKLYVLHVEVCQGHKCKYWTMGGRDVTLGMSGVESLRRVGMDSGVYAPGEVTLGTHYY